MTASETEAHSAKSAEMRKGKIDAVRALFVPGDIIVCVDNTYHRAGGRLDCIGREWTVGKVGKSVWFPADDGNWRGTFPERASDVLQVDDISATWRIGRDEHTVTYARRMPADLSAAVPPSFEPVAETKDEAAPSAQFAVFLQLEKECPGS